MASVAIIDYGMGNLHSITKALEYVGGDSRVFTSHDPEKILRADRVVFPGVGGVRHCMEEIRRLELDEVIMEISRTKPMLGVCLGMQALLDFSDENQGTPCLKIIAGKVQRFPDPLMDSQASARSLKVPHMGWNRVRQTGRHPLWRDIEQESWFYFVHSYHAQPENRGDWAATTEYGIEFASGLARDNVFALQCHPEKSQRSGLTLLANFLRWNGQG